MYVICILSLLLCTSGFNVGRRNIITPQGKSMLKELVYTKHMQQMGYTVYIQENGVLEPYLVLDKHYGQGILLLRQHTLNTSLPYSDKKANGSLGGYYGTSAIDTYLNTDFLSRFSENVLQSLVENKVSIADKETVTTRGDRKNTELISRKVFLLSLTEINSKSVLAYKEGKPLAYFKDNKKATASMQNYWLRSAYLWDDIQAWTVLKDGGVSGAPVSVSLGVRQAFCLEGDLDIKEESLGEYSRYVVVEQ